MLCRSLRGRPGSGRGLPNNRRSLGGAPTLDRCRVRGALAPRSDLFEVERQIDLRCIAPLPFLQEGKKGREGKVIRQDWSCITPSLSSLLPVELTLHNASWRFHFLASLFACALSNTTAASASSSFGWHADPCVVEGTSSGRLPPKQRTDWRGRVQKVKDQHNSRGRT